MNRIVVTCGYMGSGSSAITDLVSEFKDFNNDNKSYEFVFLHCPNGLFDLEDKLLLGNNALRSDEAIRSFESQMKKLCDKKFWWVGNYNRIVGQDFLKYTNNFINSITKYNFHGYWYTHEEVNAKMFTKLLLKKPIKMISFNKLCNNKILKYNDGMKISFISAEDFYKESRKYIYSIVDLLCKSNDNIILDQLLLPHNMFRIENYFDNKLKVFVVERDPRDVFILNKYIWNKKGVQVPLPTDVKMFCQYYKDMRNSEKKCDSKKIYRIKFEDLIYKYDNALEKIYKFLKVTKNDHVNKYNRFNPKMSINNTQVFHDKKYKKEVAIIEKELKEYLYDFPYEINNKVEESIEFE